MTVPLFSGSRHLQAYGPSRTYTGVSLSYNRTTSPDIGDVSFDDTRGLSVWNGHSWISLSNSSNYNISMTADSEDALTWAINKMREERRIENLAKEHSAIKDLLDQKNEIENKIKMVELLIKEEKKVGTT